MLYLKPPFHMIKGTAIFADHLNERQFYYLPAMPHLTTSPDPVSRMDIPQIQLMKFRGSAGNGGFLTFEVNLGIDDEVKDDISTELRQTLHLRDNPILSPVVLESGTVRLIILGQAKDDNGQPLWDDDQQPRYVVDFEQAASPALYGDNQAIFSVELDQRGVELIEKSLLQSELMPVGVVYSLDFYALRPAFTVKVTADWDRVQTHFEESFQADVLFFSYEVDEVVDKLIEDQVIKIEVDSFLPEGEDAGSWIGRREQAVNEFRDMVLENFFKPSIEPMKGGDDWDRFADTVDRLGNIAATGGVARFSYVKKDMTRIDKKRINLEMKERVTVKRSIFPQATLRGLGRFLPRDVNGNVDAARFIQEVTLDDPWFEKRTVQTHSLVDFNNDKVESVNITLTYDDLPRTIRLTRDQTDGTCEWNSVLSGNKMVRPVDYEYQVSFKGVDTADRPGVLYSGQRTSVGDQFEISPRGEEMYFIDDIKIGSSLLPWDRYPQVVVNVRYVDEQNKIRLDETFILTKEAPEVTWKRFRLNAEANQYDVQVTFLSNDYHDVPIDWRTTDQECLIIRNPHPLRRTLQIAPAVDWQLVAMIFVELRYLDEANDIDEQQTITFFDTPEDRAPKTFSIKLVDGNNRLVSYDTTIVLKDNRTIVVPKSMTAGSIIVLRTDMVGHRIVSVKPPNVDFIDRGIIRIEAELTYTDEEAGLNYRDKFTFTNSHDVSYFEFDYVSNDRLSYSCKVLLVLSNGLVQELDLGRQSVDTLILPSG